MLVDDHSWQNELKKLAIIHRCVMEDLFEEIFSPDFMEKYTSYETVQSFYSEIPWPTKDGKEILSVPHNILESVTNRYTEFERWEEMWEEAKSRWEKENECDTR